MSAQAVGWVWEHSPYKGAKLIIHLAVADVVNDAHDHEFWMRSNVLAEKTRLHAGNVRRWLSEMVEDGALEVVNVGGGRRPTKYRFRFSTGSGEGVTSAASSVRGCRVVSTRVTKEELNDKKGPRSEYAAHPEVGSLDAVPCPECGVRGGRHRFDCPLDSAHSFPHTHT